MITCKRVFYITIKLLSIIGIVICLSGIAGSWIVNGSLKSGISKSLSRLENVLKITENGFRRVDSSLIGVQEKIDNMSQGIIRAGDGITDNTIARTFITAIAESEIESKVEMANDSIDQIHEMVALVNLVIETANGLPFFSIPILPSRDLLTIQKRLSEVQITIQDIELVSGGMKSGVTEKSVTSLTTQIAKIDGAVENIRNSISEFQYSVRTVNNVTAKYKANLSRWINLASIVLSIVLLWFISAQLCLYIHSRDSK